MYSSADVFRPLNAAGAHFVVLSMTEKLPLPISKPSENRCAHAQPQVGHVLSANSIAIDGIRHPVVFLWAC